MERGDRRREEYWRKRRERKMGIEQNIWRERKGREEQKEKESIVYNIIIVYVYVYYIIV